jgi:zinc transporter, ZIP family
VLGAVIGAAAYNQELAAFLIGVGVGAIVQVIGQLLPSVRDRKGQALYPLSIAGMLVGAGILYLTSLLVSV